MPKVNPNDPREFICRHNYCKQTFNRIDHLHEHERILNNPRVHSCSQSNCGCCYFYQKLTVHQKFREVGPPRTVPQKKSCLDCKLLCQENQNLRNLLTKKEEIIERLKKQNDKLITLQRNYKPLSKKLRSCQKNTGNLQEKTNNCIYIFIKYLFHNYK